MKLAFPGNTFSGSEKRQPRQVSTGEEIDVGLPACSCRVAGGTFACFCVCRPYHVGMTPCIFGRWRLGRVPLNCNSVKSPFPTFLCTTLYFRRVLFSPYVAASLKILLHLLGWRYFWGRRFCVLCFEICTPSLFSPSPPWQFQNKTRTEPLTQ